MNGRDQPVLIAADIEHYESSNEIGAPIYFAHIRETTPPRMFNDFTPTLQRPHCIRVRLPKLPQLFPGNKMHPHALGPFDDLRKLRRVNGKTVPTIRQRAGSARANRNAGARTKHLTPGASVP